MQELEELSRLISAIYDTALDGSLWPDVLKKIAGFIGGPNAAIWSKDVAQETGYPNHFWGFDPGYVQAYFDEYGRLDPGAGGHLCARIGWPVTQSRLMSEGEFVRTRFYREWARPQGLVDCINVALDKSGASLALLAVSRHRRDGVADDQACRRVELLMPHIRRAVLVAKAIDLKQSEVVSLTQVFDTLHAGIFVVEASGRLMYANAAGGAMLAECGVLRISSGRLVSSSPGADQHLRNIFAAQADVVLGAKGIALPLSAGNGERYVAHILPLRSGLRSRCGAAATAAVIVHKATLATPSLPEAIARSYQLTPTELNVLLAIVEVGGAPEVAEALGVATSTVKSHLAHINEKTGTKRQADLVKVVAGFANPLLD